MRSTSAGRRTTYKKMAIVCTMMLIENEKLLISSLTAPTLLVFCASHPPLSKTHSIFSLSFVRLSFQAVNTCQESTMTKKTPKIHSFIYAYINHPSRTACVIRREWKVVI